MARKTKSTLKKKATKKVATKKRKSIAQKLIKKATGITKRGKYKLSLKRVINKQVNVLENIKRKNVDQLKKTYPDNWKAISKQLFKKVDSRIRWYKDVKKELQYSPELSKSVREWYRDMFSISAKQNKEGDYILTRESNFMLEFLNRLDGRDGINVSEPANFYARFAGVTQEDIIKFATIVPANYAQEYETSVEFFYDIMDRNSVDTLVTAILDMKNSNFDDRSYQRIKSYLRIGV